MVTTEEAITRALNRRKTAPTAPELENVLHAHNPRTIRRVLQRSFCRGPRRQCKVSGRECFTWSVF